MLKIIIIALFALLFADIASAAPKQRRPEPQRWISAPDWRADAKWNAREEKRHQRSRRFIENSGAAYGSGDARQQDCDSTMQDCQAQDDISSTTPRPARRRR